MTINNGTTPQPTHDETGRPIAAAYLTAGGTCLWYSDGQLPMVRHVLQGQLTLEQTP
ncbi:hypothetical protein H6F86_20990 [Phormidium sp. FACHB-592]|uniref:Uncharacterized protein n=1 Tax=Stenomitos frigidus AS-A4 TaxID=2933935 RepID=A0ABV0KER8_9CYAN|nr:hypothetical protein [Phormidium sp. FACHB-592]MBD2076311.1 hypothetical protein [Phormidium sp. FACHB-592]